MCRFFVAVVVVVVVVVIVVVMFLHTYSLYRLYTGSRGWGGALVPSVIPAPLCDDFRELLQKFCQK